MSKFDKNNKRDNEHNPNKKKQEFEKNREIGGQKNQGKEYRPEGSGSYQGRNEERQRGFEQGKDEKNKYDQDRKDKDQGFGKKRKSA